MGKTIQTLKLKHDGSLFRPWVKKDKVASFRFTQNDLERLDRVAKTFDISKSQAIADSLLLVERSISDDA